jgi:hypothetical protein
LAQADVCQNPARKFHPHTTVWQRNPRSSRRRPDHVGELGLRKNCAWS